MSISTLPRISQAQAEVLATLPECSGRNKRSYAKLSDLRLVIGRFPDGFERSEDGDEVLAHARAEGRVPESDDSPEQIAPEKVEDETPVEQPAPAQQPAPKTARRSSANPSKPGPGLVRTCKYRDHQGQNPLSFEDATNFPLRGISYVLDEDGNPVLDEDGNPVETDRSGTAVGWCHTCQKLYRRTKTRKSFVPLADGGHALATTDHGTGDIVGPVRDLVSIAAELDARATEARNEQVRQQIADAARA